MIADDCILRVSGIFVTLLVLAEQHFVHAKVVVSETTKAISMR